MTYAAAMDRDNEHADSLSRVWWQAFARGTKAYYRPLVTVAQWVRRLPNALHKRSAADKEFRVLIEHLAERMAAANRSGSPVEIERVMDEMHCAYLEFFRTGRSPLSWTSTRTATTTRIDLAGFTAHVEWPQMRVESPNRKTTLQEQAAAA